VRLCCGCSMITSCTPTPAIERRSPSTRRTRFPMGRKAGNLLATARTRQPVVSSRRKHSSFAACSLPGQNGQFGSCGGKEISAREDLTKSFGLRALSDAMITQSRVITFCLISDILFGGAPVVPYYFA
jgi:hypothetical protein